MSSENCSHTLIFAADNVDGRLLFPAELRGRAVKAGLGVSERANAGLLTASLFSDSNGVGHSYETRQDVGRVIEEAIASIGREQFWGQLEIAGIDFGRLLMPWLWHALEAPLLLLRLLGRWCDREMPFGLATWRIDVPPPAVRGALEAFCEARGITLSHLASPRPADTSSGPVAEMSAIQGAYPFQGTVGPGSARGAARFLAWLRSVYRIRATLPERPRTVAFCGVAGGRARQGHISGMSSGSRLYRRQGRGVLPCGRRQSCRPPPGRCRRTSQPLFTSGICLARLARRIIQRWNVGGMHRRTCVFFVYRTHANRSINRSVRRRGRFAHSLPGT